jgi:EAL domain-containing protein (putative c-di-GMP-specific phosphodiesterase class I)
MASAMSDSRESADRMCKDAIDRITTLLWPRDAVSYIGNGRIGILVEASSELRSTDDFIHEVQRSLMDGFLTQGREIRTTASIGITKLTGSYSRVTAAMDDAAAALARARNEGKARAIRFSRFMDDPETSTGEFHVGLIIALEAKQFEVHFQPIISSANGQLDGFEAVLKWRNPSRGLLDSEEFFPALEKSGLMVPVGEWMIGEIGAQIDRWIATTGRAVPVTINLNSEQIRSERIIDAIAAAVEGTPGEVSMLVEITEDTFLSDRDAIVSALAPLREKGVRVVLDGMGTSACCLGYLADLPIDAIKVDAGFVRSVERYSADRSSIRDIVDFAHGLDIDVIGVRVERADQLSDVLSVCDEMQGSLFSLPVDSSRAAEMVEAEWSTALLPPLAGAIS